MRRNVTLEQLDAALATCAQRRAEVKGHDPAYAALLIGYADMFLDQRLDMLAAAE